mmetsp:Transcript_8683/g.19011  ORF Transcript_8683/g.19011 Transcript_8683/m.19011 type:complete len:212 (-) Transcript_8683:494-1129(-)
MPLLVGGHGAAQTRPWWTIPGRRRSLVQPGRCSVHLICRAAAELRTRDLPNLVAIGVGEHALRLLRVATGELCASAGTRLQQRWSRRRLRRSHRSRAMFDRMRGRAEASVAAGWALVRRSGNDRRARAQCLTARVAPYASAGGSRPRYGWRCGLESSQRLGLSPRPGPVLGRTNAAVPLSTLQGREASAAASRALVAQGLRRKLKVLAIPD